MSDESSGLVDEDTLSVIRVPDGYGESYIEDLSVDREISELKRAVLNITGLDGSVLVANRNVLLFGRVRGTVVDS